MIPGKNGDVPKNSPGRGHSSNRTTYNLEECPLPDLPQQFVVENGVRAPERGDLGAQQRHVDRGRGGSGGGRLRGEGKTRLLLRLPVRHAGMEGKKTPPGRGAVVLHRAEGGDELRGASPPPRVVRGARRGSDEVALLHEHAGGGGERDKHHPARTVVEHRRPRSSGQPGPGG